MVRINGEASTSLSPSKATSSSLSASMRTGATGPSSEWSTRTRGRITRTRIVLAVRKTDRTLLVPKVKAHLAAKELAKRPPALSRGSGRASASTSASRSRASTSRSRFPSEDTDDNDEGEMTIILETEDVEPISYTVSRTERVDLVSIKKRFQKQVEMKGTCTLHLNGEQLKHSAHYTAKQLGLKHEDVIQVRFW